MRAPIPPQSAIPRLRHLGHWVVARSDRLIESRVLNALARRVPELISEHGVPGVQCAFGISDRPTRQISFGIASRETLAPLTNETRFLAASLSKPVTALVCLELASQGKINIEQPIRDLVGAEYAESLHQGLSDTSLRSLLSHTAEVPCLDSHFYRVEEAGNIQLHRLQFERSTRAQWEARKQSIEHSPTYTARGYSIVQLVIERYAGMPFEDIARSVLPEAIHSRCQFSFHAACQSNISRDHAADGTVFPQLWTPAVASSGMICTATDHVNVMRYALQNRHRAGICDLFARPAGSSASYTCGLHLWKNTDPRILDHGAARPGMRGVLKVIPDANMVFAMFSNGAQGVKISQTLVGLIEELGLARLS